MFSQDISTCPKTPIKALTLVVDCDIVEIISSVKTTEGYPILATAKTQYHFFVVITVDLDRSNSSDRKRISTCLVEMVCPDVLLA